MTEQQTYYRGRLNPVTVEDTQGVSTAESVPHARTRTLGPKPAVTDAVPHVSGQSWHVTPRFLA